MISVFTHTDKYFSKTREVLEHDPNVSLTVARYGVFLRRDSLCAVTYATGFIRSVYPEAEIEVLHPEGAFVPANTVLFTVKGDMRKLVELETIYLQRTGLPCVTAYNAYRMCMELPSIAFMDMCARHTTGPEMAELAAYGASIGSRMAKAHGSKGFIGSSTNQTAPQYGKSDGMGTMPHALIGLYPTTLDAVKAFIDANPGDKQITALVDFYGTEVTDSLEIASWFHSSAQRSQGRNLSIRLDTHGGRYAEGLDYETSVRIVSSWLHVKTEWEAIRRVIGDDAFDVADNAYKDRVRRILFGTGVSAANIINLRNKLDYDRFGVGSEYVGIVASSGFDLFKCKIMAAVDAPIDMIGTGSFLPETFAEINATSDIFEYDGEFKIKVGRESVFLPVARS